MQLLHAQKQSLSTTNHVSRVLTKWAIKTRRNGSSSGAFVLDGAKVSDKEIGDPGSLLPVFAWHAENLYRYGIRTSGLGFQFNESEEALLRRVVNLDKTDRGVSEVLCFMIEAVEDAKRHLPRCTVVPGATELRGLVNQFVVQMGISAAPGSVAMPQGLKPQA